MQIRDIHNPWRDKWQTALFRDAMFFVEVDTRTSGRRVALHQYPKRNVPYAEDMGRSAYRFIVQGYLIGPAYLDLKDNLIAALEKDGPGWLRLPLPFQSSDQYVMVMSYSVAQARERGGYCQVEMDFAEYGDPSYRAIISTTEEINKSATNVENDAIGPRLPTTNISAPADNAAVDAAAPYAQTYQDAGISNVTPDLA